jgi:dipeptidyl-peptidase-4
MNLRSVLLASLTLAIARADHGNLASFNELTSRWYGVARTPVLNDTVQTSWAADDSLLLFSLDTAEGKRLMKIDPARGEAAPAVEGNPGFEEFRAGEKGGIHLKTGEGWRKAEGGKLIEAEPPGPSPRPDERRRRGRRGEDSRQHVSWQSPDKRWEVALRDGTLFLKDTKDNQERELAKGDDAGAFRGEPVWAPDSSRFALWKEKDVEERIVHYIESSPKDQLQPKYFNQRYPKPGDVIDTRAPWVFFTGSGEPIAADPKLIENPFECDKLAWRGDSTRLTFEFVERGFGKHNVIEIDTAKREQRVLVREESDTFVFVYGYSFRRDLNDGEEILWMSERDGWKHLYLLDGRDGSTKRQLTKGEWIVREVVNVDEANREVLLKISGCYKDQDPYYIHYARVSIDTGKLVPLTEGDGTHDRFERSPGGKYYTCRWSRVDRAPVTELRRWEDGKRVATLAEADDSKLRATAWPVPQPFVAKDRDGKFDIHGVICLPPDFDPAKKYPVIENIYAGPQDSFVPKAWSPWMGTKHEIAVHGFIVVQIDGKGTANRSKEFHHFCYKNLKDAGFPDRIAWLKEAAKKIPQMDLERVGIYGGSAGGQNALGALLFHGDFYKAAVADCGCHDNRMDKIWWNEQWMDWPVGPEYADNSNVTHAKNLKGALLLTVGEVDTNVDPASTYQVINALIAADKDFEFLPMTGRNHGSGEERYGQRRRVDFFRDHLGGPK